MARNTNPILCSKAKTYYLTFLHASEAAFHFTFISPWALNNNLLEDTTTVIHPSASSTYLEDRRNCRRLTFYAGPQSFFVQFFTKAFSLALDRRTNERRPSSRTAKRNFISPPFQPRSSTGGYIYSRMSLWSCCCFGCVRVLGGGGCCFFILPWNSCTFKIVIIIDI